jgi:hypothetical protein
MLHVVAFGPDRRARKSANIRRRRAHAASEMLPEPRSLSQGTEERGWRCAVAEGLAHVGVEVDVAGTENETPTELKRVRAQLMLPVTGCLRARPGFCVVTSKQMQKVRRFQAGSAIGEPLFVDQQRKRDSSLFAKQAGVAHIAKTDRREIGALGSELLLMVAQLRNMLAAEDSSVMAKEDDHGRAAFP